MFTIFDFFEIRLHKGATSAPHYPVVLAPDRGAALVVGASRWDVFRGQGEVVVCCLHSEWCTLLTSLPDDGQGLSRGEVNNVAGHPVRRDCESITLLFH